MPPTFRLMAISDRASLSIPFADWLRDLGQAGVGAVQIREKDLDDRSLFGLARLARAALSPATRLLVNGRLDVALAAGADGVHLPADGVPAAALRARFGGGVLIGRSTHRVEEVERARDEGADYVTFGPVYETPGKGAPVGVAELARAAAAGLPVYALGGVTLERLGEVAAAGASGIAAIRMFQRQTDLAAVARAARECFDRDS
ncbi:MAG TPA: thiamine phosphate synthase [Thermoanaerobaculia bacterium]